MQLELRSKEDSQLIQKIVEALSCEGGQLPEELESQLTAEVLARIELQLLKAVIASGQLKVGLHHGDIIILMWSHTQIPFQCTLIIGDRWSVCVKSKAVHWRGGSCSGAQVRL